jgi:transaldolase
MLEQGRRFAGLAPNMQVKFPATAAGLVAIEEATELGISINATVSFTLPQALAVGAAVERALERREAAGLDVESMSPVCTLMVGRLDDWMKTVCQRDGLSVDPGALDWAGIAVAKRAAGIFRERGYRTRLLVAAFRHHLHWSEFIGGDVSLTIPYAWQQRFNASTIEIRPRFSDPAPAPYIDDLVTRIPDFARAYEPDGLTVDEFDTYGATVRTLRGFIASYWDLVRAIDDIVLPNPDVRA